MATSEFTSRPETGPVQPSVTVLGPGRRLLARSGCRLHRRCCRRQPDVLEGGCQQLEPRPCLWRPFPVRGRGDSDPDPGHLRSRPQWPKPECPAASGPTRRATPPTAPHQQLPTASRSERDTSPSVGEWKRAWEAGIREGDPVGFAGPAGRPFTVGSGEPPARMAPCPSPFQPVGAVMAARA